MKNLYVYVTLLFGLLAFSTCSSDKNSDSDIISETFLEKYEGTVWHIAINEFNSEFMQFKNSEVIPWEIWGLIHGAGCYEHYAYSLNDFDAEITENEEDLLEIVFLNSLSVWTIEVDGDQLFFETQSLGEPPYLYVYDQQEAEVIENLDLCNE